MKSIKNILDEVIKECFLQESNQVTDNEDAQQLIDIISMNPKIYGKYIELLKTKYNVDFYDYYNDENFLRNPSLADIKKKDDFLNFDNYTEYAKKIYELRKITQPNPINKTLNFNEVKTLGIFLGYKSKTKEFDGTGNYASFDLVDTITVPNIVDVNTLIHEIGHYFDHNYSKEYKGLAKTITYASSFYSIIKSNEVFAENFMHFFIAPAFLKNILPEVYNELNSKIPSKFKIALNKLIK